MASFFPPTLETLIDHFASLPGIGKKSAQQIFLELEYKLKAEGAALPVGKTPRTSGVFEDVLTGLLNLGMEETRARELVKDILAANPGISVSDALRIALKSMGKRKS